MKICKQIGILAGIIIAFVTFDICCYTFFTTRYISKEEFKAKSIELDKYLPFEEGTLANAIDTDFAIEGNLPVIDGAAALYPVFSAVVGSIYPSEAVHFDGNDFTSDSALLMNNTMGSYQEIVNGTADIVFCAYPSDEQLQYATENGVELEFTPVGKEAFVFLVNENNPVNNLSSDQIREIYAGKIRKWSEVGGENRLITPLRRNKGSGSQSTMDRFMGDMKIPPDYDAAFGKSIAFSFRFYVSDITQYGKIKLLSVDGVYPNIENIRNESYPLASYFYAVTRKGDDNPNTKRVIEWILSDEGQKLVEANGYAGVGNRIAYK